MVALNQALVARRLAQGRIELCATREQFAPQVYSAVCEDELRLTQFLPWLEQFRSLLTVADSQRQAARQFDHFHDELRYMIFEKDSNRFLGTISLIKAEHVPFSIGYWLSGNALGQGYMTEAVNLLGEYAHYLLGIEKLHIRVAASNGPSRRVAQRCGYQALDGFWGWDVLGNGREDQLIVYEKTWNFEVDR